MTVLELKSLLNNKNYDSGVVSYNEGEKIGGFNIEEIYGIWRFYLVDDKGNISNEKKFLTEDDLCSYVIDFTEREHRELIEALKKREKKKLDIPPTIIKI